MSLRHAAALALLGWYLIAASDVFAMECEDDSLSDVSGSGAILEMSSGQIYEVQTYNRFDSRRWRRLEDVLVCSKMASYEGQSFTLYTIINKDEDAEEVSAKRLK
jgi:hypothetical protein